MATVPEGVGEVAYLPNMVAQEAMYWEARRQGMGLSDKQIGDLLRAAHDHVRPAPGEEVSCSMEGHEGKLPIIGHDLAVMRRVAAEARKGAWDVRGVEVTPLREERRGYSFRVRCADPDGNPTGHIARVTVELEATETAEEREADIRAREAT